MWDQLSKEEKTEAFQYLMLMIQYGVAYRAMRWKEVEEVWQELKARHNPNWPPLYIVDNQPRFLESENKKSPLGFT